MRDFAWQNDGKLCFLPFEWNVIPVFCSKKALQLQLSTWWAKHGRRHCPGHSTVPQGQKEQLSKPCWKQPLKEKLRALGSCMQDSNQKPTETAGCWKPHPDGVSHWGALVLLARCTFLCCCTVPVPWRAGLCQVKPWRLAAAPHYLHFPLSSSKLLPSSQGDHLSFTSQQAASHSSFGAPFTFLLSPFPSFPSTPLLFRTLSGTVCSPSPMSIPHSLPHLSPWLLPPCTIPPALACRASLEGLSLPRPPAAVSQCLCVNAAT